ncbi:plasmid partitioning protein RepB [Microvirga splendida]|uniref:Plasmid partitioning protein RepB n=1 Tax=Microvirga splendida TaxID=2795727 RepID=A0ABS0Y3S6_9HYPH|nr:plasmid partitioning protein RepB [Microvirga splendida]MBJ6126919.1 plasmid partitioning protein RepB [Microvirga splendida]
MGRKNLINFADTSDVAADNMGTTGAPAPNPVGDLQAHAAAAIGSERPLPDRPLASRLPSDRPLASRLNNEEVVSLPSLSSPPMTSPLKAMKAAVNSADRVEELEEKLRAGQAIVDLDPADIDASFVPDRMAYSEEAHKELVAAIRSEGQQVPILVRPHPERTGRYQVAYGHRRLRAIKELGTKIRAVVRDLTDEQLVVAQGQENNARTNLSFIEKARFAFRLEERGFRRDVIMQALCVDKAVLSKMLSVANAIPAHIIDAIGPAPKIGRRKWEDLAALIKARHVEKVRVAIERAESAGRDSDAIFEAAYRALVTKEASAKPEAWVAPDGVKLAKILETDDKFALVIDRKVSPEFGKFLASRLEQLYNEFQGAENN